MDMDFEDGMNDLYDVWDELYGDDSDDGFDARRDFGGDVDAARMSLQDDD